jgi:hypothetical protein
MHKNQFLYFIKKTLLHNKMTTLDWLVIVTRSMGEAFIIIIILKFCLLMQEVKSPNPHFLSSLSIWGGGDDTRG